MCSSKLFNTIVSMPHRLSFMPRPCNIVSQTNRTLETWVPSTWGLGGCGTASTNFFFYNKIVTSKIKKQNVYLLAYLKTFLASFWDPERVWGCNRCLGTILWRCGNSGRTRHRFLLSSKHRERRKPVGCVWEGGFPNSRTVRICPMSDWSTPLLTKSD